MQHESMRFSEHKQTSDTCSPRKQSSRSLHSVRTAGRPVTRFLLISTPECAHSLALTHAPPALGVVQSSASHERENTTSARATRGRRPRGCARSSSEIETPPPNGDLCTPRVGAIVAQIRGARAQPGPLSPVCVCMRAAIAEYLRATDWPAAPVRASGRTPPQLSPIDS